MVQRVCGAVECSESHATPVILYAVSLTTLCICVCVLFLQAEQISELKTELTTLKTKVEKVDIAEHAACCCGVWGCYTNTKGQSQSRVRREVSKRGRQRRQNRTENRTILHLQALSSHSLDEEDCTIIKWTPGWSQGEGIQVSGETVTVMTEGPYFIYSQVLYRSTTWIMGQVITKRLNGTDTKILKCVKNMPADDISNPLNSCYTAGVFFLESGAVLELSIPRRSAGLVLTPYSTFFGMYSVW